MVSDKPAVSIFKTQQIPKQLYCTYLQDYMVSHARRPILIFTTITTSNLTKQGDMINMTRYRETVAYLKALPTNHLQERSKNIECLSHISQYPDQDCK